jgi:hypothetical protein
LFQGLIERVDAEGFFGYRLKVDSNGANEIIPGAHLAPDLVDGSSEDNNSTDEDGRPADDDIPF